MVNSSKKLPCGHIFHTACLRSWFQRQQTCPTCRLNILRTPITATQPPAAAANQPQMNNQNINENQNGGNNNNNNNLNNNNIPLGANPFANLIAPPLPDYNIGANAQFAGATAFPMAPGAPFVFPSMPFMTPYAMPPPPMPPNLDTLSDDEVRALEGIERHNVEERIKLLQNVQLMLNASVALMNQYNAIVSQLPIPVPIVPTAIIIPPTSVPPTVISPNVAPPTVVPPTVVPPNIPPETNSTQPSSSTANVSPVTIQPSPSKPVVTSSNVGTSDSPMKVNSNIREEVKIENFGSEEHLDLPSSSQDAEANELRRRRLQKFYQSEQNDSRRD